MDVGKTVDEITVQLKRHHASEKLLRSQDERVHNFLEWADKLISQNHFESPVISDRANLIKQSRAYIKHLYKQRGHELEDILLYVEFINDVTDMETWIVDKHKQIDAEIKTCDMNDLENKVKKLKKYQSVKAEVSANEGRVREIKHKANTLLSKGNRFPTSIHEQISHVTTLWNKLINEVNLHGKGLEEAQDILDFNNELDKLEAWIRDKEIMIQAGDTGTDYEHCQILQRKLDDVDSDMRVDDTKIKLVDALAEKLLRQGYTYVQPRRNNFVVKLHNLQGDLNLYREKLSSKFY